ncbi:unnamed protein product [Prorocentrum cordatum]|uniref:Uncharacterized protein n=1 Tax=Prorocentrum cordatum TaxID=2364126 RepID=A0ABN9VEI7_9DINO|nr:unnamed protein product [Polarella glacialis]
MPRGFVHEALCPSGEASWHATLAVATHDWSWTKVVAAALQTMDAGPSTRWRAAVPLPLGAEGGEGSSESDLAAAQRELEDFVSEMRSRVTAPVLGATLAQRLERHNAMQEQSAGGFLQALDQARARRADTPAWRARRVTLGTRLRQATPSEKREDQLLAARCKGGCKGSRKASGVRSRRLFALQMSDEVIC